MMLGVIRENLWFNFGNNLISRWLQFNKINPVSFYNINSFISVLMMRSKIVMMFEDELLTMKSYSISL